MIVCIATLLFFHLEVFVRGHLNSSTMVNTCLQLSRLGMYCRWDMIAWNTWWYLHLTAMANQSHSDMESASLVFS
ncbi:hypothetical protein QBC43DRAFT_323727, partial [Cladorrhinum sp. PSN259]